MKMGGLKNKAAAAGVSEGAPAWEPHVLMTGAC